ncbi:MAG: YfiR family protein [Gallionellaceae bacterium]|nr:YfiR family protein [Gallionellaceae bacterium]
MLPLTTAHAQIDEYAVKAAFLYKFGLFVEWPNSAFPSPTSPVNLCIVGEDPFGKSLDTLVAGERVKGRTVVIRRLKTVGRNPACHILYAGGSEEQSKTQIIEAMRGSNVLIVSDSSKSKPDKSRSDTGVINFVVANNRVRFEIDDEAAAQNGLLISSKLMSLALNVKRRTSTENR